MKQIALKCLTSLTLLTLLSLTASAQKNLKREVRGVWVTTYLGLDWPLKSDPQATQRTKLVNILEQHRQTGVNTIYFQVRNQSDAMYPSTLEPWSYDLTGQQGQAPSPVWDPVQFALDESRKRGMEFHAWINPFRAVGTNGDTTNPFKFTSQHIYKKHPEWMLNSAGGLIINPGIPAARAYVLSVIVDILMKYDVDGIHFDDYFYTSTTVADQAAYLADPRGFPNTSTGKNDWRRDNINLFIKAVYDTIKALKPWVKFGVSPSGIYRSSTDPNIGSPTSSGANQHYSSSYADSKKWLQQGWVDYIAPQVYWYIGQTGSDYSLIVPWWNNNAFGRHIYIGMANYKVNDATAGAPWTQRTHFPSEMRINRNSVYPNVYGSIFFRTAHLSANALNHRDSLRLRFYTMPALQPTMPWRDNVAPASPTALTAVRNANNSVTLRWQKPATTTDETQRARQFVIYRSTTPVIDVENQANIQTITVNDTAAFTDTKTVGNTTYYYTVTSIDRFHNESAGSNIADNLPPVIVCPGDETIATDANCSVTIPDYTSVVTIDGLTPAQNTVVTVTQFPAAGTVLYGVDTVSVALTATDLAGYKGNCYLIITRVDNTPPVITNAKADPSTIWAPNHKMKTVNVSYNVSDNCGPVTTTLSVASNEPETGLSAGDNGPDMEVISNTKVKLRAERSAQGTGRVYTITITATDASGNSSSQTVTVTVPHDHSDITSTRTTPITQAVVAQNAFTVQATPNPATDHFTIHVTSSNDEKVRVRVMNIDGRVLEKKTVSPNSTFTVGNKFKPGNYYIELIQGDERRVLKVVKM
jgi:uncharacterized lipoprotein YddW (UPF0748 family)